MVKTDDKAKAEAAYKFAEYACHNAEGIKTRVDGGAFPADNDTLASDDFLPFEVYARGVYSDDAGGAYTDKSVTLAEGVQA